jgi:hypothetical protein
MNYQLNEDETIELLKCLRYNVLEKTGSEIIFKHEDLDLTIKFVKKEHYHLVHDIFFAYYKVVFAYGDICGSYKYHIRWILTKIEASGERDDLPLGYQPKRLVLISIDGKEENGFFQLGIYLKDKGFHVTYITRQKNKDENILETEENHTILHLPFSKMRPRKLTKKTISIFKKEVKKPELVDIIHSMNWMSGVCGYKICKKFKIRHLHNISSLGRLNHKDRHNMRAEEIYRDKWELKIFESAEYLIVPYNKLREDFFKLYPKEFHKKVILIPNGVDHEIFKPRPGS